MTTTQTLEAREAAVEDSLRHNHRDPDTQLFARRAAQISFLAGVSYQAREGKGEAGEPPQPNYTLPYPHPAPPAPKDERVERLVEAARKLVAKVEEHENKRFDCSTAEMVWASDDVSEALRAFGDGKAEGGRG